MFELLYRGGFTMILLFACSVTSMAIVLERIFSLRKDKLLPPALGKAVEDLPPGGIEKISRSEPPSSLSNILNALFDNKDKSEAFLAQIMEAFFRKELNFLERGLEALFIIASISPLLGLLGTVIGMVEVFNVIAQMGVGQASALSGGISKALVTTVVGLIIAIPTLVFHGYFSKKVEIAAMQIEYYSQRTLSKIVGKG